MSLILDDKTQQFEMILNQKKSRLLALQIQLIRDAKEEGSEGPGDLADDSSRAEAVEEKDRLIQHYQFQLKKIEEALFKAREGTYGYCEDCEEEISTARLKNNPEVTLCRNCQEMSERTPMARTRIVRESAFY